MFVPSAIAITPACHGHHYNDADSFVLVGGYLDVHIVGLLS